MWIYLAIGGFFILLGLAVHVFKWHFLIAGYNTMSREKKANVDTKKPPFIYLESEDNIIFFNLADSQQTKELYRQILNRTE